MIRLRQIKIALEDDNIEVLKRKVSKKLGVTSTSLQEISISKKSLDARDKNAIYYVYEVDVKVDNEDHILKRQKSNDIFKTPNEVYQVPHHGTHTLTNRPVVVGSGPAGLFASYLLAEEGYRPIVLERGEMIRDRVKTVNHFWETGELNEESNVSFGEGGAGTFSDGKLNTLVKDSANRGKKVFETFILHGAPEEIKYLQKPHIGSDLLVAVIENMRNKIIELGGEFRYNSCLSDLTIQDNQLTDITINNQEKIQCEVLVLAIGHSARDTYELLYNRGLTITSKPFAVGLRISHLQKDINESQYGKSATLLPPSSYKLTYTTSKNRGVYSFCMCPGGYVVNASSEKGRLAINGMSNHNRDTSNANSAIVVTVNQNDFGSSWNSGIKYQRTLEEKAFHLGKGKIPTQLVKDFMNNQESTQFGRVKPLTKGSTSFANLRDLLPLEITDSILEALPYFNKKIKGFMKDDALLMGIESRTSSPVRILRDANLESNIKGIYPCGEGAGYAGGITTASIDGLKVAEEIIKKYL